MGEGASLSSHIPVIYVIPLLAAGEAESFLRSSVAVSMAEIGPWVYSSSSTAGNSAATLG